MHDESKHVRRLLREAAADARRRELDHELQILNAAFERWRQGKLTGFDLADRIHQFHNGPNRELYVLYSSSDRRITVGGAVLRGILQREELHPDLLQALGTIIELDEPDNSEQGTSEK